MVSSVVEEHQNDKGDMKWWKLKYIVSLITLWRTQWRTNKLRAMSNVLIVIWVVVVIIMAVLNDYDKGTVRMMLFFSGVGVIIIFQMLIRILAPPFRNWELILTYFVLGVLFQLFTLMWYL